MQFHYVCSLFFNIWSLNLHMHVFVDFSSAFNTIVPVKLINTLQELGVRTSL